jgi:hypothetical protein
MIKDKAGNMLYRSGDVILLDLLSEDRRRRLGTVTGEVITMKRNPSKHLLRVANAYGFCYELLATAKKAKVIRLMIQGTKDFYHITIKDILEHGDFLFFKKQGFEKQIFLTLEQLEKYGVKN